MTDLEMQETISTYNSYLDRMAAAMRHFCEDLEESNFLEISPVITSIAEGLDWINSALESFVRLAKVSAEKFASFQGLLKNMYEALQNKDYVLLHDLLEYELIGLISELKVA